MGGMAQPTFIEDYLTWKIGSLKHILVWNCIRPGRVCLECGGGGEGSVESGGGAAGPQGVRVPVPPRHPALLKHPGLNIRALINYHYILH